MIPIDVGSTPTGHPKKENMDFLVILIIVLCFGLAGIHFWLLLKILIGDFDIIQLNSDNRMVRIGFGLNEGRWFYRIDFWFFGIRIR